MGISRYIVLTIYLQFVGTCSPTELRWPAAIAPYSLAVLAPKGGSKEAAAAGQLVEEVTSQAELRLGGDVILDDR